MSFCSTPGFITATSPLSRATSLPRGGQDAGADCGHAERDEERTAFLREPIEREDRAPGARAGAAQADEAWKMSRTWNADTGEDAAVPQRKSPAVSETLRLTA
jgi:hypothetical protein